MARIDHAEHVDPWAPAIDGVCAVLESLTARIEEHLAGAIRGEDPDDLHQLRVAVRSSRAVLSEMKTVVAGEVVLHARQELAWLGRVTSPARDLDVMADAWPSYASGVGLDAASTRRIAELIRDRGAAARAAMEQALGSGRGDAFLTSWAAALADPAAGLEGRRAERPLARVVARRVTACHDRLVEHGRRIGPASAPADLHDLRKDAKSVRYVVDHFATVFDERARRRYSKRLRALQRVLGAHQDADVHAAAIRELAGDERVDAGLAFALGRIHERLVHQQAIARAEFDERFEVFDSDATASVLEAAVASITD